MKLASFVNVSNRSTSCRDTYRRVRACNREHGSELATRRVNSCGDSEDKPIALFPRARAFAPLAGTLGGASRFGSPREVSRTVADDLENPACEWRGDARTMRGISVLNFARRSWQRVTRRGWLLDVVPWVAMTFGFDRVVVRVVSISITTSRELGSDLCCAGRRRRRISPPPTWIRHRWWVTLFFNLFEKPRLLRTTHVWRVLDITE